MKLFATIKKFFQSHRFIRRLTKCIAGVLIVIIVAGLGTFISLQAACRPGAQPPSANTEILPSKIDAKNIRPQVSTYLTYPEWFIVYSSDEYAQYLEAHRPSQFPYFGSIRQYWSSYCKVFALTKARGEFNAGDHFMLFVIGWSYSAEMGIKGVYENTIGRLTELSGHYPDTDEDKYADHIAKDYVTFIRLRPWYEYHFAHAFGHLWTDTHFFGPHFIRKIERKLFLSAEYGVKTVYGWLIGVGSHSVYGVEDTSTYVVANHLTTETAHTHPEVTDVQQLEQDNYLMNIPRYQPFTDIVPQLAQEGITFSDIAGNREIFLTALVPTSWRCGPAPTHLVFAMTILTQPAQKRVGIEVPVESLGTVLNSLRDQGATIEHIYDF